MLIKNTRTRIFYLDALKGILIILVILGHSIQFNTAQYQYSFLFRFIYSFHMPLFFAISGYLAYKGWYDESTLKKRLFQLALPFVFWAIVYPLFISGHFDLNNTYKTLLYPDNGLWFLYNLFFYCILSNCSEKFATKRFSQEFYMLLFLTALYVLMFVFHTLFNVTQICWYFPFFLIGFYIHKYSSIIEKYEKYNNFIGVIFIFTMPLWMMREVPLFYKWINLGTAFSYIYRYTVEIAGTLFFFFIGKKFLDFPIVLLNKIGTKTLGIYAFQFVVLHYLGMLFDINNSLLKILIETCLTVPICYLIVCIIEKIKYLNVCFIGYKIKKR